MSVPVRLYYESNGRIRGWDNGDINSSPMIRDADFIVVSIDEIVTDNKRYVVDIEAINEIGPRTGRLKVRLMTPLERKILNVPNVGLLLAQRSIELQASDFWENRAGHPDQPKWLDYRQALRDITAHGDAANMLEAWPLRPDGSDALAALKTDMEPL